MKVLLCPSVSRDKDLAVTKKVNEMITEYGAETAVCPLFDGKQMPLTNGLEYSDLQKEAETADMAIAFGGDGTILRTARAVAEFGVPIIAVNMGNIGFMAELEPDDTDRITQILRGDYKIVNRIMLNVELVRAGKTVYSDFALNDVVVKGASKIINLEIFGGEHAITSFSGDGTVIATPTGSTAYSMAAGGPIVEPDASNIIITPICPHELAAKSFVLAPERVVRVKLGKAKSNPAVISVDGGDPVNFFNGDEIIVKVSPRQTKFIQISNKSFYRKVYEKLGEKR